MGITAFPFSNVIDVPTARILGRDDAGTGAAEALTTAEVLTLLSVYTTAQVDTLLSGKSNVGHTHTPSDITGFGEAVDDEVATLLTAGTGISLSYNDNANTLTIASTISAGISSLNGLTDSTQTFAVGTSGTDVAFVSAAGVHTLNIPSASTTARGVVTTGTQSFAGEKTFTGDIWANTGVYIPGNRANFDYYRLQRSATAFGGGVGGSLAFVSQWSGEQIRLAIDREKGIVYVATGLIGAGERLRIQKGATSQGIEVYNTYTSDTSFERLNIAWASNICTIEVAAGSAGGTLRGLRIGGASTSLLGFYGATPVDRPDTIADPAGGGTIDTEARTAINTIIDRLQELGLIA